MSTYLSVQCRSYYYRGDTPPLGLELRVLGLYEDVEVPHQPEEGEDTAAAAADGGVELHDPEV